MNSTSDASSDTRRRAGEQPRRPLEPVGEDRGRPACTRSTGIFFSARSANVGAVDHLEPRQPAREQLAHVEAAAIIDRHHDHVRRRARAPAPPSPTVSIVAAAHDLGVAVAVRSPSAA